MNCIERTEVINGIPMKQILTDQLSGNSVSTVTSKGVTVNVTGVNFQILSSDVLTMTLALQKNNFLMNQNTTAMDDSLVVVSQCSVQLSND